MNTEGGEKMEGFLFLFGGLVFLFSAIFFIMNIFGAYDEMTLIVSLFALLNASIAIGISQLLRIAKDIRDAKGKREGEEQ